MRRRVSRSEEGIVFKRKRLSCEVKNKLPLLPSDIFEEKYLQLPFNVLNNACSNPNEYYYY
jgi:hypothetical protein